MANVVITGSAGRIGSCVAAQLLARGDRVTGVDLQPARLTQPGYRHIECRFDCPATVQEILTGADAVVHTGALMSWHPKDNDTMVHANVTATRMLLEAAKNQQIKRFIFASSGEVYPEVRAQSQPVTEQHPRNPLSFYGLTKLLGEELVQFYQR